MTSPSSARPASDTLQYWNEQLAWQTQIRATLGDSAVLVYVSVSTSDVRVYRGTNSFFKVRRQTIASVRGRANSLEDEALILQHLQGCPGIPTFLSYQRADSWEFLETTPFSPLVSTDPTFGHRTDSFAALVGVARLILSLNKRGCSHGDLRPSNIGQNIDGGFSCFDFDQAVLGSPTRCAMRDFLGIPLNECSAPWPFLRRLRHLSLLIRMRAILKPFLHALIGPAKIWNSATLAKLPQRVALTKDHSLGLLAKAWELAAHSDASSPGIQQAYYSLDVRGIHYPGERPWALRWDSIHKSVQFKNKRVVELGCNMGLLSVHAHLAGASECKAIDRDPAIIASARLVAEAFGAPVTFGILDVDSDALWEAGLKGGDIVCALSVVHWVKDKERLWSFLGSFPEILYESHDSEQVARQQLASQGYTSITTLIKTERTRPLLYATKHCVSH